MEGNPRGPRQNEAAFNRREREKFYRQYSHEETSRTGPSTGYHHHAMHTPHPHTPRHTNGQIRQRRGTHQAHYTQGTPRRPKRTQGNTCMPPLSTQRALRQKLPHQTEGVENHSPYHHPHRNHH